MPLGRTAQPVARSQMGLPSRLVLDDEQSSKGAEIVGDGIVGHRILRSAGIRGQRSGGDRGGDVAGEALDQSHDPLGPVQLSQALDVAPWYLAKVVANLLQGLGKLQVTEGRPSTATDRFGQVRELEAGVGGFAGLVIQECRQGDLPAAGSQLVEGHRSHSQATDPSGPRVAGLVVGRLGGAGEDELAGIAPFVDRAAHVVPDFRRELPLVDQPGDIAAEDQGGIQLRGIAGIFVDVEKHLAVGDLTSGFGLAACLWPLDKDRPSRFEPILEFPIRDSRCV